MPTVLLIRHGRTNANASGVLAGLIPAIRALKIDPVEALRAVEGSRRSAA